MYLALVVVLCLLSHGSIGSRLSFASQMAAGLAERWQGLIRIPEQELTLKVAKTAAGAVWYVFLFERSHSCLSSPTSMSAPATPSCSSAP